jgi:hypothetical protein
VRCPYDIRPARRPRRAPTAPTLRAATFVVAADKSMSVVALPLHRGRAASSALDNASRNFIPSPDGVE